MRRTLLALILLLSSFLTAMAERYVVEINAPVKAMAKLAALQITLAFNPPESFVLKNYIVPSAGKFSYKTVDQKRSVLRMFFTEPVQTSKFFIYGEAERGNYSGQTNVAIKDIKLIASFAQALAPENFEAKVYLSNDDEILPYVGITSAKIMGPSKRPFIKDFWVSIDDIESYGFDLDKSIDHISINGVKALLIDKHLVSAKLHLDEEPDSSKLDIELQIELGEKLISKKIGKIEFI